MAGDWIKVEENTPDKPEVCQIAAELCIDPDAVTGKLIRIWSWASRNCYGDGVTGVTMKALLDRFSGVTGFCDAMVKAGWLIESGETIKFPNFEYHISQPAKDRALAQKRVAKMRASERNRCNGESVTKALPEKRIEEVNALHTHNAGAGMMQQPVSNGTTCTPPSLKDVVDWGATAGIMPEYCTQWHQDMTDFGWSYKGQSYCTTSTSWRPKLREWWKQAQARKHEAEAKAAATGQHQGTATTGQRPNFSKAQSLQGYLPVTQEQQDAFDACQESRSIEARYTKEQIEEMMKSMPPLMKE